MAALAVAWLNWWHEVSRPLARPGRLGTLAKALIAAVLLTPSAAVHHLTHQKLPNLLTALAYLIVAAVAGWILGNKALAKGGMRNSQ
jgi:hypothetical protein